jgi:phage tail protein X
MWLIALCSVSPKAAVTASDVELVTNTEQVVFAAQAPVHAANELFESAASVNVTCVLFPKLALQVPGHLIPAGLLTTVPDPAPMSETVIVPNGVNVAVTELAEVIVNTQGFVLPLHEPAQDPKESPLPAEAVSVTTEFCGKPAEHVPGHVIPAGLLVTLPGPDTVTVSSAVETWLKAAVTVVAPEIVTVQLVALFAHAPPQPANVKPLPGDSVRVTEVFCANVAEQVVGQLIPAGLLVTAPVPDTATVSCGVT